VNEDKSTRYHRRRRRADAAGTALVGIFLLILAASGASALFRTAAEWMASWLPWPLAPSAAVALFAGGLAITVHVIELPFAWYQGFWLERRYGLSTQILPHWLADHVKAAVASVGVMVAGLSAIYLAMRWTPAWWWAVSAALFVVAMVGLARLAPVLILPVFYRVRPLSRPELSARLMALGARAGAPVIGAYEWALGGHTRKANAALAGIGRSRRILISDTMLDAYSEDEIEVILAHELSHHVHHDLWRGMALQAATIVAGFYVAAAVLEWAVPWLGLRGITDVAGAPVLLLVAGVFSFAMLPLGNAMSRAQERRADRFALGLTRNPAAFVTAMRRLSQQNLAEEQPSRLARWLFYSHPPMRERIAAAQAWADVAAPLHAHAILPAKE
jgi:STE24 endopeptidase